MDKKNIFFYYLIFFSVLNTIINCDNKELQEAIKKLNDITKNEIKIDKIKDGWLTFRPKEKALTEKQIDILLTIDKFIPIKHLILDNSNVLNIDEKIKELKNLKELSVEYSNMKYIPFSISKLYQLESLNFNSCSIRWIPDFISNLVNIKYLKLEDNLIDEISKNILNLKNLENLWMPHNDVKIIPDEIEKLENLYVLSLGNNNIKKISKNIANLKNLEFLDLSGNNLSIKDIPKNLLSKKGLRLTLDVTDVKNIPSNINARIDKAIKNLSSEEKNKKRYITKQIFDNAPQIIKDLGYKQINSGKINLSDKNIKNGIKLHKILEILAQFSVKRPITELDLSKNKIQKFPQLPRDLRRLKKLNLSSCNLKKVDVSVENLKNLIELNLDDNPNTIKLPKSLEKRGVKITGDHDFITSKIEKIIDIQKIIISEETPLSYCNPEEIADGNVKIINKEIDNTDKIFNILDKINHVSEIKILNISNSNLKRIPYKLEKFTGIEELYLKNNQLTEIPLSIGKLQKLKVLDISKNKGITDLPYTISKIKDLTINLSEIKNIKIPSKIIKKRSKLNLEDTPGYNLILDDTQYTEIGYYEIVQLLEKKLKKESEEKAKIYEERIIKKINKKIKNNSLISNMAKDAKVSFSDIDDVENGYLLLEKDKTINNEKLFSFISKVDNIYPIKFLKLSHFGLTKIPESIQNLSSLEILNVYDNNISEINLKIKKLKRLILGCNCLTTDYISKINNTKGLRIEGLDTQRDCEYEKVEKILNNSQQKNIYSYDSIKNGIYNLNGRNINSDLFKLILYDLSNIDKIFPVKELSLSSNNITYIPTNIVNLKSLEKLILGKNKIKKVAKQIFNLKQLKELDLSDNKIEKVDYRIQNLKNLIFIDLSNNELLFLPDEITKLKNLQSINISDNNIIFIPKNFPTNKSQTNLIQDKEPTHEGLIENTRELSINEIGKDQIEKKITKLANNEYTKSKLGKLSIIGKNLNQLPEKIKNFKYLRYLNCSDNNLEEVPEWINNLEFLQELILDNNNIKSLKIDLKKMNNLRKISLKNNRAIPTKKLYLTIVLYIIKNSDLNRLNPNLLIKNILDPKSTNS